MANFYLLCEQIVDPASGEILGRSGEENPERLMEYLSHYESSMDWPEWLQYALNTCYQSNGPFFTEEADNA